jgi:hypothetical protein
MNISIGDIFIYLSNEVYRVILIQDSKEFPEDPVIEVETYLSGIGFEKTGLTLTAQQTKDFNLKHYKAV